MKFINTICTLILVSLVSANPEKINLFIKPIGDVQQSSSTDSLGFIQDNTVYLVDNLELNPNDKYCIGTKDLENHECFTFVNGANLINNSLTIDSFLGENGEIDRLALNFDESKEEEESGLSAKDKVRKHKFNHAVVPNMNAESIRKQRQQQGQQGGKAQPKMQKIKQKKLVKYIDDDGNQVEKEVEEEVEVEVDERSWVQKNWMYIVPPLLLIMAMGGESK